MLRVRRANAADPGPAGVIAQHQALMLQLFPAELCTFYDKDELSAESIRFYAATSAADGADGAATLGVGALAVRDGYGEVKSLFTVPEARGKGVAAALLRAVEDAARAEGLGTVRLETGKPLEAAQRLYARFGYARRGPFGAYDGSNPYSLYYEKKL